MPEGVPAQGASAPTRPAGTPANAPTSANNQSTAEDIKTKYAFYTTIAGLGLVALLYIATIFVFALLTPDNLANNVVASMGAVTGVIGSLVAAYFGLQVGTAGKGASDAKAEQQAALASAAMGQLDPNQSQTAIQNARQILQTGVGVAPRPSYARPTHRWRF